MTTRGAAFVLAWSMSLCLSMQAHAQGATKNSAPAGNAEYPRPIANMIARGKDVSVLHVFKASGGLTGYVMLAGNKERRIYYVTPDGTTALYGLAFDADLNNLTAQHLAKHTNALAPNTPVALPNAVDAGVAGSQQDATASPAAQPATALPDQRPAMDLAQRAQGAFVEGQGLDVYIVFDPACPFCHRAYRETRGMTGLLRLHWIPVGELGQRSKALAQSFLDAPDKGAALAAAVNKQLPPAAQVSPSAAALLAENAKILKTAGVSNVPLFLYQEQGRAKHIVGVPSKLKFEELLNVARSTPK